LKEAGMELLRNLENDQLSRDEKLREYDETIQELKENVRQYISSGEKSCLLDEAEKCLGEFQSRLGQALQAESAVWQIADAVRESPVQKDMTFGKVPESVKAVICGKVQEYFDAVSVMSQLYTIASISSAWTKEKIQQRRYDHMREEYHQLDKVVALIHEKPYSKEADISRRLDMRAGELGKILNGCSILFHEREFGESGKVVSLSYQGYDYVKYAAEKDRKYSRREIDVNVYKNSVALIEALRKNEFSFKLQVEDADLCRSFGRQYSRARIEINDKAGLYGDLQEREGAYFVSREEKEYESDCYIKIVDSSI